MFSLFLEGFIRNFNERGIIKPNLYTVVVPGICYLFLTERGRITQIALLVELGVNQICML